MKIDWSGRSHNFSKKDINYLTKVIKDADPLTQGKYLKKFESDLSKYLKVKNIYALSSAAAALELIAILLNIKKNDEIIIPAHTYCASAIPFARYGAKIKWADIDFNTRVVDVNDIIKKINKRTKAIVVVHLYGYAFDVNNLKKKINNKKIKIIEDCAQAFGSEINKNKAGTLADFSCFSFHAQKNITTLGEGGAIYVKNANLAKKIPGLRLNGHRPYSFKRKNYWLPAMINTDQDLTYAWPYKFSLSEIQCAAGIIMLKKIDKLNDIRIKRAKKLTNFFKNDNHLIFNKSFNKKRHVYHLLSAFCVPSKKFNRDKLIKILFEKFKIKCAAQYYPLYKYPLFIKKGYGNASCPNTNKFYNNMISFPFHVWMNEKKFDYLIKSIILSIKILKNINKL